MLKAKNYKIINEIGGEYRVPWLVHCSVYFSIARQSGWCMASGLHLIQLPGELLVSCQLFLLGQLLDTPALLSNLAKYWVSSLPCCLLLPQRFSLARQVDHRRPFHWFVQHHSQCWVEIPPMDRLHPPAMHWFSDLCKKVKQMAPSKPRYAPPTGSLCPRVLIQDPFYVSVILW